jgi:hypothetical protein
VIKTVLLFIALVSLSGGVFFFFQKGLEIITISLASFSTIISFIGLQVPCKSIIATKDPLDSSQKKVPSRPKQVVVSSGFMRNFYRKSGKR